MKKVRKCWRQIFPIPCSLMQVNFWFLAFSLFLWHQMKYRFNVYSWLQFMLPHVLGVSQSSWEKFWREPSLICTNFVLFFWCVADLSWRRQAHDILLSRSWKIHGWYAIETKEIFYHKLFFDENSFTIFHIHSRRWSRVLLFCRRIRTYCAHCCLEWVFWGAKKDEEERKKMWKTRSR